MTPRRFSMERSLLVPDIVDQEGGDEGIDERCDRVFLSCREDWLHRETLPKGLIDPMVSVPGGLLISGSRSCLTYTT